MSEDSIPVDSERYKTYQASLPQDLESQILDSRIPKSEREWWASSEIRRLRDCLAARETDGLEIASLQSKLSESEAKITELSAQAAAMRYVIETSCPHPQSCACIINRGRAYRHVDCPCDCWIKDALSSDAHRPYMERLEKAEHDLARAKAGCDVNTQLGCPCCAATKEQIRLQCDGRKAAEARCTAMRADLAPLLDYGRFAMEPAAREWIRTVLAATAPGEELRRKP